MATGRAGPKPACHEREPGTRWCSCHSTKSNHRSRIAFRARSRLSAADPATYQMYERPKLLASLNCPYDHCLHWPRHVRSRRPRLVWHSKPRPLRGRGLHTGTTCEARSYTATSSSSGTSIRGKTGWAFGSVAPARASVQIRADSGWPLVIEKPTWFAIRSAPSGINGVR